MRIVNSYISDQPKLSASNSGVSSADQAGKQRRIQQARDSYNKNAASAEVIEAEYVDLYTIDTKDLRQEHQNLHLTLEPEMVSQAQGSEIDQNIDSILNRYQTKPIDMPLPGTYLNIFA